MGLQKFLNVENFAVDPEEIKYLKRKTAEIVGLLKESINKNKIDADVFVGGSFAKGTMAKSDEYDIDVFVRFGWNYEDPSKELSKIFKSFNNKLKILAVHGSRDYYRIEIDDRLTFEIIPVVRIKKVREARNVTDLSYFHVGYVRKKANEKIKKEILIAKKFCKSQGVYGAESYIGGFSGYGIECLIINYKTFDKMLKEISKIKLGERVVLDPAKHYKKKGDALIELNESKLNSPIILIDPTWKDRNVLAALNEDSFLKFQKSAREFLKKPSLSYFDSPKNGLEKKIKWLKNIHGDFAHVTLFTDRQEGDIAGTKMKKFSKFLIENAKRYFDILGSEFSYSSGKSADFFVVGKSKKEVILIGPPLEMEDEVKRFKKKHGKNCFEKNGFVHAREKINSGLKEFVKDFAKRNQKTLSEMGIIELKVD